PSHGAFAQDERMAPRMLQSRLPARASASYGRRGVARDSFIPIACALLRATDPNLPRLLIVNDPMVASRRNTNSITPTPAKKRIRRNEETLIAALQAKIAKLEERKARKAAKADPTLKLADKLVRMLKKAEGSFIEA